MNKMSVLFVLSATTALCAANKVAVQAAVEKAPEVTKKTCAWLNDNRCANFAKTASSKIGSFAKNTATRIGTFTQDGYVVAKNFAGNHKKAVIITSAIVGTAIVACIVYKLVKKHNAKKTNRCECCEECSCQSCNLCE